MAGKSVRLREYLSLITKHANGVEAIYSDLETESVAAGADERVAPEVRFQQDALKKIIVGAVTTPAEDDAAEAIIDVDLRPAPPIVDGTFQITHATWRKLSDDAAIKARIEARIPSVGRIELPGDLLRPYGGTGFVVGDGLLMTNRHVAQIFASGLGDRKLAFKPGSQAAIDFQHELGRPSGSLLAVKRVVLIHPYWDMALLQVVGLDPQHKPLSLSLNDARDMAGREIFVIGYPYADRRNSAEDQQKLFDGKYGYKRLQPGVLHEGGTTGSFGNIVTAATHDSSTLGGNSGSAVFDLATGEVLGLHFAGVTRQVNYAVPAFELSRDGRVVDAGVRFSGTPSRGPNTWGKAWAAADLAVAEQPMAASERTPVPNQPRPLSPPPPPASGAVSKPGTVTIEIPLRITIDLATPAAPVVTSQPHSAVEAQEALVEPFHDTAYDTRKGYDPRFLGAGQMVPMPEAARPSMLAPTKTGETVLAYENFSIRMHAARRLALVTASNVTAEAGLRRPDPGKSYKRRDLTGLGDMDQERWFLDPRLDERFQLPDTFFTHDRGAFDKGHIVRRDDVAWGATYDALRRANGDSFHVTNCSPQVAGFNRSTSGETNWGDLENVVLAQAASERLCVFAGPVLAANDQVFVGTLGRGRPIKAQIPSRFWKVIVARTDDGLAAFGFVLEQDLVDVQWEFAVPSEFVPTQASLADIEAMTGVVFDAALKAADQISTPRGDDVSRRAGARPVARGRSRSARDADEASIVAEAAVVPAAAPATPDGYVPPAASLPVLAGIPFTAMKRVGTKYTDRFARWDAKPQGKSDPSLCRGLYQLPGGALFWDSKMALDADGASEDVLSQSSGWDENTSLMFKNDSAPVNAEVVPYFVLPAYDSPKRVGPGLPWEGSKDHFKKDFKIELGALGVVIFKDKITGAIFADEGPAMKIGEASIRAHELLRKPPLPWKGDPADKKLIDASEEKGVLYFVFPSTKFDINAYGPAHQQEMAAAIHKAAMAEFAKLKFAAPAPVAGLPTEAVSVASDAPETAAAAKPVDVFAFGSNWEGLLSDLKGKAVDPDDLKDIPQRPFAKQVVNRLLPAAPGTRVMIGFDAGAIEAPISEDGLADIAKDARTQGALLEIYVEGPGGPTGGDIPNSDNPDGGDMRNWERSEVIRIVEAAQVPAVGVPAAAGVDAKALNKNKPADRDRFRAILKGWDDEAWWRHTRLQLVGYKKRPGLEFVAAEIDNLPRVFDPTPGAGGFPESFKKDGLKGLLGFLRTYALEFAGGVVPQLLLKNLTEAELRRVKAHLGDAAIAAKLPRAMFADFHICEIAEKSGEENTPESRGIADASAAIGIQTVFSKDTRNYRAQGRMGAKARAGFQALMAPPQPTSAVSVRGNIDETVPTSAKLATMATWTPAVSMDPRLRRLADTEARGGSIEATVAGEQNEVAVLAVVSNVEAWKSHPSVQKPLEIAPITMDGATAVVVTGRVDAGRIEDLRKDHELVLSLKAGQPLHKALSVGVPDVRATAAELGALGLRSPGEGVVVGIVDFGCDFAHRNFIDGRGKTRIEAIWNQQGNPDPRRAVPYGSLHDRTQIDAALASSDPYGTLGYEPQSDTIGSPGTHGTHVMDIAAGSGGGSGVAGMATQASILFVDLASSDVAWRGPGVVGAQFGNSVQLIEAVKWIFEQANDRPCVINLSLGTNGGPHDGSNPFERAIDALVAQKPNRAVVIAASNSHAQRIHARTRVVDGTDSELIWFVPKPSEAECEIWYPGSARLEVELITPDGVSLGRVAPGDDGQVSADGGETAAFIASRVGDPMNGDNTIGIYIGATAPPGTWRIVLHAIGGDVEAVHAWIERNDKAQSSFADAAVDNNCTLGSIACGRQSIVVAAYQAQKPGRPIAEFSSAGPTRDGRDKPEITAPGQSIRAARSRTQTGVVDKSGTSMAAPFVTGGIAILLGEMARHGRSLDITAIRAAVMTNARHMTGSGTWDNRFGAGGLDVVAMLGSHPLPVQTSAANPARKQPAPKKAGPVRKSPRKGSKK